MPEQVNGWTIIESQDSDRRACAFKSMEQFSKRNISHERASRHGKGKPIALHAHSEIWLGDLC